MLRYLLVFIVLLPGILSSQNIPAYTFVMHDSTVTGYYFLSSIRLGNMSGTTPAQMILDEKGEIIYYKPLNPQTGSVDFKLQPDSTISYCTNGKYYILDSTFNIIDSIECVGLITDVHDLQVLPNHHYLLMGVKDTLLDLSSYPYFYHNGTFGSANALVTGNIIQELDENKNLVFEWSTFDHFQFDDVSPYFLFDPNVVDWTHCNAVELDVDGNILLSTRHFNEITKIDHLTGNILWRMGGKNNQFTFYNEPYQFRGQHDIRRIANGDYTLFDNGKYFISHGARGVEYQVNEFAFTATLVWSYMYDPAMNSQATGNMQRVSDNRSLINFGSISNHNICFAFVDSLNNMLSELSFADSSFSYRTFFYPTLPWSFNRPQINCYQQGTDFYLETINSYSSYHWSSGDTTSSLLITAPGDYYVDVPYGGGFIRSEKFVVDSLGGFCSLTSMGQNINQHIFSVTPNPVKDNLFIAYKGINKKYAFKIYDVIGHEIYSSPEVNSGNTFKLDVKNWNRGIYFLRSENYAIKFVID